MRRSGRGGGARRQGTSNASRGFSGRRSSSGSSSSGRGRGRGRGGGSRWRNNSSSNGRGRGRGRGSYKKKLPRKPKGPSMKQLTKRIRTAANAIALGTGDSNALQRTLDEASRWQMTVLDGKTVQQVALEFCRTGLLDQATETVRKIRSGDSLSAAGVAQILSSLPASVEIPPLRGASFVDELLAKTEFADGAVCHEYFRTRARWVVLEYLQESQDARDKMKRIPVDKLVRMGHTVLADTVEKGMKNDELVFRYDSRANRAEDGRRTLQGGDLVQIRFMGNGASSTASESMGSAQSPSPPSLCVEATVELGMPLICKPVLKAHLNKVLQVGSNAPASTRMQWRVDKLANNIQFQRQMRAILTLSTLTTDRAASGTKKTQNKKAGGKNDPRPAREICLAITESCYLSSFNSDGTPHASPTLPNSLSSRWGAPRPGALTSDRVGEVSAASDASATAPSPRGPVLLSGHPIASLCGASCLNQFGQPMPGTRGLDLGASRGLNPSQAAALAAATSRRLTLVQGPPGTGKTQVSVRILQYWVRSGCHASTTGGARGAILACSDSNIAVDNILMGLVKRGVRAVRLGRPENTRPELLQYSVDEMTGAMLDNNSSLGGMTQKQSKQEKHLAKMRVLNRAQVICATCIGAGSQVLDKMRFAAVLIDEAGQATELATVVPLTRGCQQLVLVGDHYQLPPTVTSDDAKAEGLCVSLFERLAQAGVVPALLDTQYRMHPAISCFASDCFYGGRIRDGISARDRPAPRGFHWPRPEFPVAFLDVPAGVEVDDGGSSKANPSEAQLVMRVVSDLVRRGGIRPADVGIVTPYAAQVRALRRLRDREGLRDVECASVDGFQGREKHVIVISTVRANDRGSVGFLKDWCRCNVAITRAQSGLIVVGNERTLRSERRSWAPWLEYVFAHGCAVGYSRTGHYDQSRTRALATGNGRGTSVVPTTAPSAAASSSASQLSLADMQRLRDIAAGGSGRAPRPPAAEIGSRTLAASSVRSLPANSRLRYEAHEVSVPRPTTRASRFGPPFPRIDAACLSQM
eukprot:INCI13076.1.p1 GENE.INCI13076.1~~INCI13076.1.p1  ORF type:complete len:1039 (+),score=142.01 INCI13076.1:179-3295(+)